VPNRKFLLDVNILIALADAAHTSHKKVTAWFNTLGKEDWGVCPLTEAGFVRVVTNPRYSGPFSIEEAIEVLTEVKNLPGYRFWPITTSWTSLIQPFSERIFGHQQVTDAYLLGLALEQGGTLVTMDKTIKVLAGPEHERRVLVLD
jgi:toxin-antitoxin system PIN domain toxin